MPTASPREVASDSTIIFKRCQVSGPPARPRELGVPHVWCQVGDMKDLVARYSDVTVEYQKVFDTICGIVDIL